MSWIIFFFGTGLAFFTGIAILFAALLGACLRRGYWAGRVVTVAALFGLMLVALSSTPLPYWFYGLAGIYTLLWMARERWELSMGIRRGIRLGATVVWFAALLLE